MKKILFLILIVILGVLVYVFSEVRGDENSKFNQSTRYKLGRYSWARGFFSLHRIGDAKAQYLLGAGPLIIEIIRAEDIELNQDLVGNLGEKVQQFLGRPVQIFNVDVIKSGKLSSADIQTIVKEKRRHFIPGQPNFFVVIAQDFEGRGQEVGETYQEFGALLSYERLKEITSYYPFSLQEYLKSVILHELGHQVGLTHNDKLDCIMNKRIDNPEVEEILGDIFTPIEPCNLEKEQLENIKASLK